MDLEAVENETVRLSVPTRFLKSWVQSHYSDRVLRCWQAEEGKVQRIELTVRSAVLRSSIAKPKPEVADETNGAASRAASSNGAEFRGARRRRSRPRMRRSAARRSIRA